MTLLIAAWLLAAAPVDESPASLLVRADQHFGDGQYAAAAAIYDRLAAEGTANGLFFLNQGNAHYLAGNLPAAILAYRRAERFLPHDYRLQANLAMARSQVLDPTPDRPSHWWSRLGEARLVRLSVVVYLLGWGLLCIGIWHTRRRWLALGMLGVALGLAAGFFGRLERTERLSHPLAVVAVDRLDLRRGNGQSYPVVEINNLPVALNAGMELQLLGTRPNGWAHVRLRDGAIGWIPLSSLLIDEP